MWRTVRYFYTHTYTEWLSNALSHDDNISSSSSTSTEYIAEQQLFFHFPFHPVFAGHQHTIHPWYTTVSSRRSIFRPLFLSLSDTLLFFSLVFLSFFRRPWLQEFYQLPSSLLDVHPADFISPYTLQLLLIPFLPCASQSPSRFSRHAFLGIFITQLCHYSASSLNSHNSRNFCLFDTPPSFPRRFFFILVPSRTRVLSKQQESATPLKWDFGR